jgi:ABC-type lipoprotein export system ATPase subunit
MFKKLNEQDGITVILVTHDPEVANHAKRAIRIRDGLIEAGAMARLTHAEMADRLATASSER